MYKDKKTTVKIIQQKYDSISFSLSEKSRRLWAASEALACGYGGIKLVSEAIAISNKTIDTGIKELSGKIPIEKDRVRRHGGGRKTLQQHNKNLTSDLKNIISPHIIGDPENLLLWTSKSVRNITEALCSLEYRICFKTVSSLLKKIGFSLQSNVKKKEGKQHPDRDKQFHYINDKAVEFCNKDFAVISVDTKKKENIGDYKNNGKEYCPKGLPIKVNTHDFPDKKLGKVAPYGVYDVGRNKGWVSVGISKDTAQFAVNSIRSWWYKMGYDSYKNTSSILITADCGGSNGNRVKLWKTELQKLSNEIGKDIHVCHFPPGTSKWNKIEHRMFSYISKNWRGRPLITTETVVNLISNTKTDSGLKIMSVLDSNEYEKGIKVSNEDMEKVNLVGDVFHPEWNYKIMSNSV